MKNRNQLPRYQEERIVVDDAHAGARRGTLAGAGLGGGVGALLGGKRRKLLAGLGGAAGAVAGNVIGRKVGTDVGARDVRGARAALRQMSARLDDLEARAVRTFNLDRLGNAMEPDAPGEFRPVDRPSVRGARSEPGNGVSSEARFAILREKLCAIYGWGIVSSLSDDELSPENCERLRQRILGQQGKVNAPRAGVAGGVDFERRYFEARLGTAAASRMSRTELHALFVAHQRNGLVTLEDQSNSTDFSLVNRARNSEGEFSPESAMNSSAIQRAYHPDPRVRRTGKDAAPLTAAGAAAGLLSAAAYMRSKRGRRPRLAPGIPRLNPPTIDVDSTGFSMTAAPGPGRYSIRRRTLRGKKQPGVPRVKVAGQNNLAFLIQDDDFPLVPMKQPKLAPGMRQRVKPAKTRAEMLKRLKAITALSRRDFVAGSLAVGLVEGAIDAVGLGGLAGETPTQRQQRLARLAAQRGNVAADQERAGDPSQRPRTLDGALQRASDAGFLDQDQSDFAIGGTLLRDAGVIAGADLTAEELHDLIQSAQQRKRKKAKLQVQGGVEAQSPAGPTTMAALHHTVMEFDDAGARARARKRAEEVGAAGAGGIAGAVGGLKYNQGKAVRPGDARPGDVLYRRFGPGGLVQHHGVVGSDGKVTHRTARSDTYRSIKPDSFRKIGRGPTYREDRTSDHLPRGKAAENASRAAGTSAGAYRVGVNDCQGAAARLATRRVPASGQLRRALGGAALGAAAGAAAAHVLSGKRRKDRNAS